MRKKRSVVYDYEEEYQRDIFNLDEYFVNQILKCGKKYVYATKEIRAGEQLEIEIYPEFTREQLREFQIKEVKRKVNMDNLNNKNSKKHLERLINHNFTNDDLWMTLTYDNQNYPKDMTEAKRNIRNYIRRINNKRKKMGIDNAKYIYVTEYDPDNEVRFHHHLIMDGRLDMTTVESMWKFGGRNQVRRLQKDDNGLSGLSNYISKQKSKGERKWTSSKNLKMYKERKNHYKFKQKVVEEMVANQNCIKEKMEKQYSKEGYCFSFADVRYNNFNNQFYIYARLRKPYLRI